MISFLDMAFCSASKECGNKACVRNLTSELIERGKKWWGSDDFPVAYSDFKTGCPDYVEENPDTMGFDNEEEDPESPEA